MASVAITFSPQPEPVPMLRSVTVTFVRVLDRVRLKGKDSDYYDDMLRNGLADDAATLMQMI